MKYKMQYVFIVVALLVVYCLKTTVVSAAELQPAMWPMDVVYFTQEPGGGFSHAGTLNFDIVGTTNSNIKAPFDCKIVKIYKGWAEGNTVIIQSLYPVKYADGTEDIMCMSFAHDNDVSDLWVGRTFAQGEVFYQTGNYGNVTGVHAHVSCIRGAYQGDIWTRWAPNNNCASAYSISPETALFLPEGIEIRDTKGLNFKTYYSHTCTNFTDLGVCKECGTKFVLQNRTSLNYGAIGLKKNGAIHVEPYGEAKINGRLKKDEWYTVTESVTNAFGKVWYKLEGTDSKGQELWVVGQYLDIHDSCTEYDNEGYCKTCQKEYSLQNVQNLNYWMEAKKENGALHDRPYGAASINGRLKQGQHYLVIQSGTNSFGGCWYLIVDTDGVNKWVTCDYLKEISTPVEEQQPSTPSESQAEKVAQIALSQVGYREAENGTTIYGEWWGLPDGEWCAMFACWCANQAGAGFDRGSGASAQVTALFNYICKTGSYDITFQTDPRPGDFLFFKDADPTKRLPHVGIVTAYDSATKTVTYVDGNNGKVVKDRTCKWESGAKVGSQYVYGYGRPAYKNTTTDIPSNVNPVYITVQATGAGNITTTNATVYGTASYSGNRPSEVGLLFGESTDALQWVAGDAINFSKNPFDIWYDLNKEANIWLTPGKTYYYQLYAVVDGQHSYSNIESFTTQATVSVWTSGARNVTATNATVYGGVQYSGNRTSEVGLLFGESADALRWVAGEPTNFSKNPYDVWYDLNKEANIWLTPGKTYYYQFYAVQDGQYTYSDIGSFCN